MTKEIRDRAVRRLKDEGKLSDARDAWRAVAESIKARAAVRSPEPRDVRYETNVARFVLLSVIANGDGIAAAECAARTSVGLPLEI